MSGSYEFSIESAPDYSFLNVSIPAGQKLMVEKSAMASMDTNVMMKTKMKGGLGRLLTKESLFINEFTAEGGPGSISIAPGPSGDMAHFAVSESQAVLLTGSSYVASTPGVKLDTKFQGLVKGFFSGESLFLIRCSGAGDLWFNTFGGLFSVDVTDEYIVDTGHICAFTEGLDYEIGRIGGYKSLFFSGEGFICRFRGQGRVWIQTRNPLGLVHWADGYRVVQSSSD